MEWDGIDWDQHSVLEGGRRCLHEKFRCLCWVEHGNMVASRVHSPYWKCGNDKTGPLYGLSTPPQLISPKISCICIVPCKAERYFQSLLAFESLHNSIPLNSSPPFLNF